MESVRVAVRVRPLVPHEGRRSCVVLQPEARQIFTTPRNTRFTFDYVFDSSTPQIDVYETAVQRLVFKLFKGYNVTVLAYGQTGSGMTYTMGTCPSANPADQGIIQRAVTDMFYWIDRDDDWIFNVSVSFLELYNKQLIDLLSEDHTNNIVQLRGSNRDIIITGLTKKSTHSVEDVLQCLRQGSENRTTGATAMNAHSSRSHAIFTLYIHQTSRSDESVAMSAKFHLVDLAGSERPKKTKAKDMRFMEGVNINKELFALYNVISWLSDGASYVNYRDSKLTRLLQDSLGGNTLTLMLACVSPAENNLDETVSTLRYADRARKIKNKPVNQDPQKKEIDRLKQTIEELRLQIGSGQTGTSCPPEHQELIEKNRILIEKNKKLGERTQLAEEARDRLTSIIKNLISSFNTTLHGPDTSVTEEQRKNLNQLKEVMDEAENEKSETQRLKFEEKMCTMDTSLNESGHKIDLSASKEYESQEEFVLQQAKLHKEIQAMKDAREALQAQLAEKEMLLKEEIEKHQKTEFDLNEKMMNLKTCIHDLEVAKKEMEAELKDKSCKIETLEETKSNIEKKLESQQKQVHDLSVKNASLQEELTKTQETQENKHSMCCSC